MLGLDLFRHYLMSKRAGSVVRTVAWLCILGVLVGVTSLVVVMSVMNGFNRSIRQRLLAVEPHLVAYVQNVHTAVELESTALFKELAKDSNLQVQSFESQDVILRTSDGYYGGAVAKSVTKESLKYILDAIKDADERRQKSSRKIVHDVSAAEMVENLQPGEVIVGVDLARSLGVFEGDQVSAVAPEMLLLPKGEIPQLEKLRVKRLLATNVPDIDAKALFYGRGQSLSFLASSMAKEVGIEIRLADPDDLGGWKEKILKLGATRVESWRDRNSSLFYALKLEKTVMGAFLGLSALIASLSIVTVLVLLLTQKRRDIGILMAMGLSRDRTQRAFLELGLILASIGLFGGLILGITICLIVDNNPMKVLPEIYYDATIPASVDPVLMLVIFFCALIIAFVSAWIPTRQHTRMLPTEALRSRAR